MRKLILLHIAILLSVMAFAQTTPASGIPYECGFEHDSLLTHWVLNSGTPTATDKWIVGTAVKSEGRRSLYISSDGATPVYGGNPDIVAAYMRYKFPTETTQQNYEISFDWRGVGDSLHSRLHVLVCPENQLTTPGTAFYLPDIVSTNNRGRLPTATLNSCQLLGESGENFVCGSEQWQNVTLTNEVRISSTASNMNFAIVFLWVNDNKNDSIGRSSIAIDNVQISSAQLPKPKNLEVVPECADSTLVISWESVLTEFDIEYRKVGDVTWRRMSGLGEGTDGFTRDGLNCTYELHRILEGSYDVRLRGRLDDLTTNYVYQSRILVYCPDNHCINYLDLYGPNVTCTYGYHENTQPPATPYDNIGVIDFGSDAIESRHTLHIDPTEVDPRTDSLLKTVPDGALASVRLGNWDWGGEAESITYDVLVDSTNQGILIVKYAVVFENPQGHPEEDEPAFLLEVLDSNGEPIDYTCGRASFTFSSAANDPTHWHMTRDGQVAWKDWTTVGVSLMDYHGQNIKVRFTTKDCSWEGHFAYAYFTVDCANAHIETENCGNDPYVTCMAPDGFAYSWRDESGNEVSKEQTFVVDASRQQYTCRVSFKENPDCYFEISTTSEPRFPVPDYTFERIYGECLSKLKFTNNSHVMNKWEGYEKHTNEPCADSRWRFRCLQSGNIKETSAMSPTYTCPSEGDSIEVTFTCYIGANNSCDSTRIDTIVVPNIIPQDSDLYITTCHESPVKFGDDWYDMDTTVSRVLPNFAGCDSTTTLHLTVWPIAEDTYRHDSICSDQSVTINGKRYDQPIENQLIMLNTVHGCDSAIYFTLTVNERIRTDVDTTIPYFCADDEQMLMPLYITAGKYDSLQIKFNTPQLHDTVIYENMNVVDIPYMASITPGHYAAELTFYQFCCGPFIDTIYLDIRYRSSIVEQKWNDVLTVLSPKYNGGYEFASFQWYKDGEPIEGETHSYLYQPLDFASTYYVELTLADGSSMTSCPIQPEYHEQQSDYPYIVPSGQHMPMYMEYPATVWYYTISGQLYSTFSLPQGYTTLPTPQQTGAYIIKAVNTQGETQAHVMIVQ